VFVTIPTNRLQSQAGLPVLKPSRVTVCGPSEPRKRTLCYAGGMHAYTIHCTWDPEAGVWYVSESDVPGLVTEAATVEEMNRKLEHMIPELLAANAVLTHGAVVPFELLAHRHSTTRANAA
jgi:predicted RNase H-like HicB family nuclease